MSTPNPGSGSAGLSRRDFIRVGGAATAVAASTPLLSACGGSGGGKSKNTIRVWWDQGYYPAEGESVKAAIKAWEKSSGKTAELTLVATDSLAGKMTAAVQAGNPPEVAFGNVVPSAIYASEDELVDVTDLIEAADLVNAAKKGAHLYNAEKKAASYYAAPLGTTTTMIFYWKNMLSEAGAGTPPTDWDGFWRVFTDAQKAYNAKSQKKVNAIGWTMGSGSADTNEMIRFAMMAFGVDLINNDMRLNPVSNQTRSQLTETISWLTQMYKGGFIPKQAISWSSPDNNTALANHTVLMTPNSSLSIPAAIKSDSPKEWKQLVTTTWPDRRVGGKMPPVSEPWNACVFKKSDNPELGKDFLKFFMQPDTLNDWLVAAEARRIPVDTRVLDKPYWSKSKDPNVATTVEAMSGDTAVPAWLVSSAPYQKVVTSGMWGDVLGKAVTGRQTAQDAANAAIDQLTQLFKDAKQMA